MINVFSKNKYVKSYSILKLLFLFNSEETLTLIFLYA